MDKRNPVNFLLCNCPRCGTGKVFKYKVYQLGNFAKTHERCPSCNLDYQPETGFFFGAMYWSYAMIVATIVTLSIVLSYLDKFEWGYWLIPGVLILGLPIIVRYSRMLMLYVVYPIMYKDKYQE